MPHLKLAVFILSFAFLAIASAPEAYAKSRLFTYECNQEKGQLELLTFEKLRHEINEVHNAEKGIYSVWQNDRSPVKRSLTQTCEIDGHEIKITLGYHPYYRSAYGSWCADLHEHVTFIDAWLDGEKIIEKLRFHPGCMKYKNSYDLTSFFGVFIKPLEKEKGPPVVQVKLDDREFYIKLTSPFPDNNIFPGPEDRPLKNHDVHNKDDMVYFFEYLEPEPSE